MDKPVPTVRAYIAFAVMALAAVIVGLVIVSQGDYYVSRRIVCVCFALFVCVGTAAIVLVGRKTAWRADAVFLAVFVPLSLVSLIVIPPFSTPDSYEHFLRSYEIAHGRFVTDIAYVDQADSGTFHYTSGYSYSDGGLLPVELDRMTETREVAASLDAQVDHDRQEAYPYSTQAAYSPVAFLPSAIGIFLVGLLTSNVWAMVYVARALTCLFAGTLLFLSVRIAPRGKPLFALIGLLPMSLELYASMSPDVMAIALCTAFFSYVLRAVLSRQRVSVVLLAALMIGIALAKIVYLPVCLLVFFIPDACFQRNPRVTRIVLFVVAVVVNLAWLVLATGSLVEYNEGVNPSAQLAFMASHPVSFLRACCVTLVLEGGGWVLQLFGSSLNWLNAAPPMLLPLSLLVVFVAVCTGGGSGRAAQAARHSSERKRASVPSRVRIALLLVAAAVVVLIFLSLYIQWNPVGAMTVSGIQGRYFIPILPLVAIAAAPNVKGMKPAVWVAWFCVTSLVFLAPLEVAL